MRRIIYTFSILLSTCLLQAQSPLSPEKLLSLGRVSPQGMSKDGKTVYYSVSVPNIGENKNNTKFYSIPTQGGQAIEIPAVPEENLVTVEQTDAENISSCGFTKGNLYERGES